ncbi:MAG: tyrosine-protein phosphatase [bacterium]|nr:tyrosine-protein phosphatase [Gammaproteobacteria bacterium]
MNRPTLATLTLLFLVLLISGCEEDIPLLQRVIPSEVNESLREQNRKLIFDAAYNFRELGGIRSADGRAIHWGKLYRSSNLSMLSDTDQLFLEELNIRHVVDFRLDNELASSGYDRVRPDSGIRLIRMPIGDAKELKYTRDNMLAGEFQEADARELLKAEYRLYIKKFTPVFREWAHSLLDEENYPMVFHCSTGKDRTGVATALVLLMLDVPMNRVMEDYLDTNRFIKDWVYFEIGTMKTIGMVGKIDMDAVKVLYGAEKEYLEAAFTVMRDQYGTIDNYIEQGLEISQQNRETLKSILLNSQTTQ